MTKSIKAISIGILIALTVSCSSKTQNNNEVLPPDSNLPDVRVYYLQDDLGDHKLPTSIFPDAPKALLDSLKFSDGIPSVTNAFLVEVDSLQILFDTGLGGPQSQLLPKLAQHDLAPQDIKYIFLTHFHGDHIGGMINNDSIVFPNAQVYASRIEYEAWMAMEPSKNVDLVKTTMQAYKDRLHLFEFGDTLPGQVAAIDAIGHTPGHTAFRVGNLIIIGDIIHNAELQLENTEICPTFDMDKKAAIESRNRILEYMRINRLQAVGMHIADPGSTPPKDPEQNP